MTKYRKKPVVIEAERYDGLDPYGFAEAHGDPFFTRVEYDGNQVLPGITLWIHTLEGDHRVSPGNMVVKGVKGEFYPVKPDIFEATYEAV